MSRLFPLALLALLPAVALTPAAPVPPKAKAADWPQFRGPNRDNVSADKGLLKSWPADGPKLAWKAAGVGQGFSSVAVAGDKVFTMGDKDGSSYVFALDRSSGKSLWEAKLGRGGSPGGFQGTRGTPTVDGDLVYAIGQYGDLVCLDAAKGKEKWRKSFPADFKGQVGGWMYSESPLVDGDKLVCTPGGRDATLVALDKKSGDVIWKAPLGFQAGYSSVVVSEAAGVRQYVQLTNGGGVVGVAAKDGKLLWRYPRLSPNTANIPTPVALGSQVFCAAGYGKGGALLTLRAGGDTGVQVKEEYYEGDLKNKHGGLVVVGDYAYGDTDDSGRPWCAAWKTGQVKWTRNPREGKGRGSASLTYADGHLYVRYANGYVALAEADPKAYKEKSGFKIPNSTSNSWAHPVVVGGKLYLREKDAVWCYDVKGK